jgi:cytoskeleton protein RodZ
MKETGKILREAREAQNISLAAVSAVTKINIKVLEAIEGAQMENLPSKTFLRGFVQTYASFLKLSPNDVLENFQKEMGTTKYTPAVPPGIDGQPAVENGQAVAPGEAPVETAKPSAIASAKHQEDEGLAFANGGRSMTSKIVFAGIAVMLIVGIYIVSEVVQKYQKESQVAEPPADIQSNALPEPIKEVPEAPKDAVPMPITAEKVPEKPKTADTKPLDPKATSTTPPKTDTKPVENKTADTKPVDAKMTEAKPAETSKPTETKPPATENKPPPPVPVAEVKPPEKPPAPPAPKPPEKPAESVATTTPAPTEQKPPPPPSNPQEVVVEALDSVRVDYRIDGGSLQSATLQPEEKRTFKAKREVKMDVSDGGAVSVNHNGKDRGVPGNLGQPMKLSFP